MESKNLRKSKAALGLFAITSFLFLLTLANNAKDFFSLH
jgi:hypothetical protein